MTENSENKITHSCPFCSSEIPKEAKRCMYCGAVRHDHYIASHQIKLMFFFRFVLSLFCIIVGCYFFSDITKSLTLTSLLIISLLASFFLPKVYFLHKNKNNSVWKKRPFIL